MVKDAQTIRRQFADELFQCVWPLCGVCAKRVNIRSDSLNISICAYTLSYMSIIAYLKEKEKLW